MSSPTEPAADELRALRERAYGRDADIHGDPAALARLHELEAQAAAGQADARAGVAASAAQARAAGTGGRVRPFGGEAADAGTVADGSAAASGVDGRGAGAAADAAAVAPAIDGPAPDPSSDTTLEAAGPPVVGDAIEPDSDEPTPADEADRVPARPWWRRRIPVLWAASVVAALLAGVGLTLVVQSLEAGRVAVLQEDSDGEWPERFFGLRPAEGRVFQEFHGLTVLSFPQSLGSSGSQTCLYVVTPPDGFGAGSCGAGSFPAAATMQVFGGSPEELRDRFPEGTALQFVLEGSQVHVYAREPGIVQPTP